MRAPGPFVLLGAGGHAKVILATALAAGWSCRGLYDDDPAKAGTTVLGVPVLGPLPEAAALAQDEVLIGFGSNAFRKAVALRYPQVRWATVVHPSAQVHPSVQLGEGSVVFAGAVIQPDTVLGRHCIVNTGATVDHDCVFGDFVHVAPGVHLAGSVRLEAGVFLGVGAVAVPGVRVGADTVVGAGAVVVRDLPGGITAAGVPAKPLRP